mmetsp:Transcript_24607/g.46804  ORF Transcript_24607/g.46804 Transcript_24607/m.46804 type:complete len:681 (-) Transcript_24607:47-2089(-)
MSRQLSQESQMLCSAPSMPSTSGFQSQSPIDDALESSWFCETPMQVTEKRGPLSRDANNDVLPDLYQEEGADVGPRCLVEPIELDPLTSCSAQLDFMEAVSTFNLGLAHHGRQELEEACIFYECVLEYVYETLQTFCTKEVPSTTVLTLVMHAHNNLGAIAYSHGEEDNARVNFDAALLFARQLLHHGKNQHLAVASVASNWCRVHWTRGDIATDSLFTCMEQVLRLRSDILPWYHVDVAASHFNLATAYHARGQTTEAVRHFRQYLDISAHHVQSNLNQIDPIPALIYLLLIQYEDKEDAVSQDLTRGLRTLQDKRQEQGNNSAEVASVLNCVGTILFHCKDYSNALFFFQEELRIEEGLDDRDRVSLAVTCNNIGRTLQERGKLPEAMTYYKRALSADFKDSTDFKTFLKETRRSRDPTTTNLFSTVWYNLGLIHDKLGAPTEAIKAFQISLHLRKLILGSMHPDIACLWYNIGVLQMERGFLNDASSSFQQAMVIRAACKEHQLDDERVLNTLQKLTSLQKGTGNMRGAIASLEQMGAMLQRSTTFPNILRQKEMSSVFFKMAELYHDLGETEQSYAMARAAVEAVESVTPTLLNEGNAKVTVSAKLATVEQWALSHLLVGSLLHENSESQQAYVVLQQLVHTLDALVTHPLFSSSSLLALRQVVQLLAVPQCAPEA